MIFQKLHAMKTQTKVNEKSLPPCGVESYSHTNTYQSKVAQDRTPTFALKTVAVLIHSISRETE